MCCLRAFIALNNQYLVAVACGSVYSSLPLFVPPLLGDGINITMLLPNPDLACEAIIWLVLHACGRLLKIFW